MITLKLTHDKEIWDDFVLDNGGHPLQLWGWGEVKASHGWEAHRLLLREETEDKTDKVIGGVQVLIRRLPWPMRSLAYVPRGPIVSEEYRDDLLKLLADYVNRNHKSVAISIEPDEVEYQLPKDWHKSRNKILPVETVILDLNKTEPELLNDMAKKTRQYIRKSAGEGIVIKPVKTREDLQKCLSLYHQTAKRAKFDIHPDQYYLDVATFLGENSQVFAAFVDDQPVAFLWIAISSETAYELYGGVNEVGQELRSNYALKWHVIRKCKEWGIGRYDFGGLIEGGVSNFKLGWTEDKIQFAGTFDLPLTKAYSVWNSGLPAAKKVIRSLRKFSGR
ncbi:MAG: lipid II:glycine glycyltransferase FemX [Thiobacillus sp.]